MNQMKRKSPLMTLCHRNELLIEIKDGLDKSQWSCIHPKAKQVLWTVCYLLNELGYDCEVTSMLRPAGSIRGESGVHATGRAIDCAPRPRGKKPVISSHMQKVANTVNFLYPRRDNLLTVLWHDVGLGKHFHIQVPWSRQWKDFQGIIS